MNRWRIVRGAVSPVIVSAAVRAIFLAVRSGVSAEDWSEWERSACWFPHLRFSPEILALRSEIPLAFRVGEACEPQIVVQFPDPDPLRRVELVPHVDEPPPWAGGRGYEAIVGVALTCCDKKNGGPVVFVDDCPVSFSLDPGDLIVLNPDAPHSSAGPNRTAWPRLMTYFRWLKTT